MRGPLELVLSAGATAPRTARRWLVDAFELDGPVAYDLAILVSEAVTTTVRHAGLPPGDPIRLRAVREMESRFRVSVLDMGDRFAQEPTDAERREPARGLMLIERLSEDWGVSHDHVTEVWFVYDPRSAPPWT